MEPKSQEKEEQLETKDMNKNLVPLVKKVESKPVEPQPVMSKENILAKKREEERRLIFHLCLYQYEILKIPSDDLKRPW